MSAIEKHWVELRGKEIMLENKHVQCFPHYVIDYLIYLHKPIIKKKNVFFSTGDNFRRKSKNNNFRNRFLLFYFALHQYKKKKKSCLNKGKIVARVCVSLF